MSDIPEALLWTIGSFAIILVLVRVKVPLAGAIFIGTVVLAVMIDRMNPPDARMTSVEMLRMFWRGATEPRTIALMIIVGMLLTLSQLMSVGGQLERIVGLARKLLRRPAVSMAAMPALIGFIPMPGGAIFSASMVQTAAGDTKISGARLSAINYWYRHVWEYWWPLYPAVLLATELSKIDIGRFASFMFPLTFLYAISGLWIFRKTHPDLHVRAQRAEPGTGMKLVKETSSVWLIVLVYIAVKVALGLLVARPKEDEAVLGALLRYLPVSIGLLTSIIWTTRINRLTHRAFAKVFKGRIVYMMVVLVTAIMIFQYTLNSTNAPDRIAHELESLRIRPIFVIALLPFISGIVTGLGIGFVGASFPIVLPLATHEYGGSLIPYVMLAFACGHLGMMWSPLHLCHVVSNRYFKTTFISVYRYIIPTGIATIALASIYFVILRWFLG